MSLKFKTIFIFLLPIMILTSCYKSNSTDFENTKESENTQPLQKNAPTMQAPEEQKAAPTTVSEKPMTSTDVVHEPDSKPARTNTARQFEPLAWENFKREVPQAALWSKMIYEIIENKTPEILSQNSADDVEIFCPKYRTLNDHQRENFWAQLFVGIARFESSWHATSSTVERQMNSKDSVTGLHVASEGLLQLSYQDEKNYGLKCGFDWNKDKKYKQKDERKTILDPYKNLNCGIQIFAYQLRRFRKIVVDDHRQLYWAVIYNGRANKIKEISDITKSLSFCK